MTTSNKKKIIIVTIAVLIIAIVVGIILKINYDKKAEQDRLVAVQAQLDAEEQKRIKQEADDKAKAEEKAKADEKARLEREAEEKKLAEEKRLEEEKKLEEQKKAEEQKLEEQKKLAEENATSKPSTSSSVTSADGKGGWRDYPGNLSDELKKEYYEYLKDYIGKPEPSAGHQIRDDLYGNLADGVYVQIEWNSKMGVWEAKDCLGTWELISPLNGGSMSYAGFGLPQRY